MEIRNQYYEAHAGSKVIAHAGSYVYAHAGSKVNAHAGSKVTRVGQPKASSNEDVIGVLRDAQEKIKDLQARNDRQLALLNARDAEIRLLESRATPAEACKEIVALRLDNARLASTCELYRNDFKKLSAQYDRVYGTLQKIHTAADLELGR